ncbi:MAG: hypothetical protein BRD55_09170 [Bacteroidetes bacterium SW_9_63_38]|nr:MAG: hypothetical protein BRD55_09170 [Bacteroidetes bacterium SW_9_63_38]
MTRQKSTIEAIAADWRESDHPPRRSAVEETLDAPNRWTEQALDHALNRWMQRLTPEGLQRWIGDEDTALGTVGVVHGTQGPLTGLRAALAAWTMADRYVGAVPASSPALLPAFAEAAGEQCPETEIMFASVEETISRSDVLIGDPNDRIEEPLPVLCDDAGLSEAQRHLRPERYSVGLVDGHESEDEMGRLAEDMLLYEGQGRRRLALLWAPTDHPPDDYLEAMAGFRGLFPAHEDTPGTLQMQQAFLEAQDQSHAYAEGMEFLLSRGEPEVQKPGHVRWTEYEALDALDEWWQAHEEEIYAIIARPHLHDQCPDHWPLRTPGGVHIPPLDDDEGTALVSFLRTAGGA